MWRKLARRETSCQAQCVRVYAFVPGYATRDVCASVSAGVDGMRQGPSGVFILAESVPAAMHKAEAAGSESGVM